MFGRKPEERPYEEFLKTQIYFRENKSSYVQVADVRESHEEVLKKIKSKERFVKFTGKNGKTLYLRPDRINYIEEYSPSP